MTDCSWTSIINSVGGPILGAGIAMLGVWRTNVSNQTRLREQLEHDQNQRREERRAQLTREICFEVAKSIGLSHEILQNINSSENQTQFQSSFKLTPITESLNKALLVGDPEVVKALGKAGEIFNGGLQALAQEKLKYLMLENDIESNAEQIEERQARQKQAYLDLRKTDPNQNQAKYAQIHQYININHQETIKLMVQNQTLIDQKNTIIKRCLEIYLSTMSNYSVATIELLICLRAQLGIQTGPELKDFMIKGADISSAKEWANHLIAEIDKMPNQSRF